LRDCHQRPAHLHDHAPLQTAFVEKLDFLTSPGHLDGGDARARQGYPGEGPALVITDKALFDFANPEREMTLVKLAPGETVDSVQDSVSWELRVSPDLREMAPPSDEELAYHPRAARSRWPLSLSSAGAA
jgi:glutaconate CoA-transferase, subunit B